MSTQAALGDARIARVAGQLPIHITHAPVRIPAALAEFTQ